MQKKKNILFQAFQYVIIVSFYIPKRILGDKVDS